MLEAGAIRSSASTSLASDGFPGTRLAASRVRSRVAEEHGHANARQGRRRCHLLAVVARHVLRFGCGPNVVCGRHANAKRVVDVIETGDGTQEPATNRSKGGGVTTAMSSTPVEPDAMRVARPVRGRLVGVTLAATEQAESQRSIPSACPLSEWGRPGHAHSRMNVCEGPV